MYVNVSIEVELSHKCDAEDIASALETELTGYQFEVEDVWDTEEGDTEVVINSVHLIRGAAG